MMDRSRPRAWSLLGVYPEHMDWSSLALPLHRKSQRGGYWKHRTQCWDCSTPDPPRNPHTNPREVAGTPRAGLRILAPRLHRSASTYGVASNQGCARPSRRDPAPSETSPAQPGKGTQGRHTRGGRQHSGRGASKDGERQRGTAKQGNTAGFGRPWPLASTATASKEPPPTHTEHGPRPCGILAS